jgi:hypothetical protein
MDEHGNTGQDRHLALVAVTFRERHAGDPWAQQDRHSLPWHR